LDCCGQMEHKTTEAKNKISETENIQEETNEQVYVSPLIPLPTKYASNWRVDIIPNNVSLDTNTPSSNIPIPLVVCHVCGTNQGRLYHEHCLLLTAQSSTIQIHNLPPTFSVKTQNSPIITTQASLRKDNITMQVQPAICQIAHYNIFPAPVVTIIHNLTLSEAFRAELVDAVTNTSIPGGFITGDLQATLYGSTTVKFSGLKLARMSVLKKADSTPGLPFRNRQFAIQFTCGSDICTSSSFTIVSNFPQLPPELQEQRPYKRTKPISDQTTNDNPKS